MRTWEIHGSMPAKNEHEEKWQHQRENKRAIVYAATAERAIALVKRKHPTLEIWSVHHMAKIDYIEDMP